MTEEIKQEYFSDGTLSGWYTYLGRKKHGKCEFYYKSGKLKGSGQFENGVMVGEWFWNRANGQPLQWGSFVNDEQDGLWRRYYDNGQLMDIGDRKAGKRTGEWKFYDRDGLLRKTQVFK